MADNTWTNGNGNNQWSDGGNWSLGHAPAVDEKAVFDNTSVADCTMDQNDTIEDIEIKNNYTGEFDMNGYDLTVDSGSGSSQAAGTFTGGSGKLYWRDATDFTLSGGTFNAPAVMEVEGGHFQQTGGTYNENTGRVDLTSYGTTSNGQLTMIDSIYDLKVDLRSDSTSSTINGTVVVSNDYTKNQGMISTGTVEVHGDYYGVAGNGSSTATVKLAGTGDQTIDVANRSEYIEINKASGDVILAQDLEIEEGWKWVAADNFVHNDHTINWVYNGGEMYGGSVTYYKLSIAGRVGHTEFTFQDDFTIQHFEVANGKLIGGKTLSVTGDAVCSNCSAYSTIVVKFSGSNDQAWSGSSYLPNPEIAKSGGTLTLQSDVAVGNDLKYTSGTLDQNGYEIKLHVPSGSATWTPGNIQWDDIQLTGGYNDDYSLAGGTAKVDSLHINMSNGTVDNGTIEVRGNLITGSGANSGSASIVLNGTGDQNIQCANGDLPGSEVVINKSSGSCILVENMNVTESGQKLTLTAGTLDLAGYDLTVNDLLTIASDGTLRLKGDESVSYGSISHSGTTEYYNSGVDAVVDNLGTALGNLLLGADKIHIFKAGDTYSVNNINSDGTSSTRSTLKSDTPGTQWLINMSGTSLLTDNVIVYDSDATPGNEITAIGSIGTYLNNDNWEFGPEEWTVAKDGTPAEFSTWASALAVLDGAVVGGDITIQAIDQTPQTYEEILEFKNCTVQSGSTVTMLGDFSRSGRTTLHNSNAGYLLTISSGRFHVKGFYFDRTDDLDDTRNAIKISSGVDNVEISHNHLIGNGYYPQFGILLEGQNDNIDIWNNLIKMWGEAAIKDEADQASLVHNIWNNTFIKCQEDLYMTNHTSTEISFWSNICDMDGSYLKECTHFTVIYGATGVDVNQFKKLDYNLYNFRTSTNMYLYTDNLTGAATYEYADLAALQAAHPTLETNGIEADPLFDTYCSDYHIADDNSPARDSADESDFPQDDNDGIMRVIPDRGCYDNDIPEELAIGRPQIDKKQNATFWVTLEDLRSSGDDRNIRVDLDYVREL